VYPAFPGGVTFTVRLSRAEVLGSERLTGARLDRLTHHVHILEMNGESYRPKSSKQKRAADRAK
jgi:DNA replication protein DnaC